MDSESIYKELNKIFKNVFDDDNIVVTAGTTADDIDEWDSLSHITLMFLIEERFNIKFKMKDVLTFQNIGEIVEYIINTKASEKEENVI